MEKKEEIIEDLTKNDIPVADINAIKLDNVYNSPILNSPMILGGAKLSLGSGDKCLKFESDKGLWMGNTEFASAIFSVNIDDGLLTTAKIKLTGLQSGSSLDGQYLATGSVPSASVNLALRGWTFTSIFSSTDYRTVAWTAGTFTASDGTAYSILAGNTESMAALNYIYLDIAVSATALQKTTTAATAIGNGKVLIAVAKNNTDTTSDATYQVFGGTGGEMLAVDNIAANSASTNEFISNTAQIANLIVTDAKINDLAVSKLTAGSITSKAITLAIAAGTGDVKLQAGKTDFGDTTSGLILGIDDSDSDTPKFEIGDSTHYLNWSNTLDITGERRLEVYTAGENIANGDLVCLRGEVRIFSPSGDTYVKQNASTTNYGTASINYTRGDYPGTTDPPGFGMVTYMKFDLSGSLPSASYIYKAILHLYVNTIDPATAHPDLREPDSDFDTSTMTWNDQPTNTNRIINTYLDEGYHSTTSTGEDTFDVTQYIRSGGERFCITIDGSDETYHTYSVDEEDTAKRPYLEIILLSASDEKIYKAQADDFQNYRAIIGVAQEEILEDNSGLVQVDGIIENITDGNESRLLYLSYVSSGYIGARESGGEEVRVGRTIGTNKIKLEIQKNNLYIQKLEGLPFLNFGINEEKTIYIPEECRKVVLNESSGILTSEYYGELNRISENGSMRITWGSGADTITIKNISGLDNRELYNLWFYT